MVKLAPSSAVAAAGATALVAGSAAFGGTKSVALIARVKNAFLTAEDLEKILFRNVERLLARAGTRGRRYEVRQ